MELIDRAAAVAQFEPGRDYRRGDIHIVLKHVPTIDAAPVVHARWMDDMYFDEPVTRCTACKRGFAKAHKAERFPYCPRCRMKRAHKDKKRRLRGWERVERVQGGRA